MAAGDFVAYYRVSAQRQGRSGLGLDAQKEAVRAYHNGGAWNLAAEVIEVESGKRSDRGNLPAVAEAGRQLNAVRRIAFADARAADLRPDIEAIRADGIVSLNGIARELNRLGVPGHGSWTATSVRRALAKTNE